MEMWKSLLVLLTLYLTGSCVTGKEKRRIYEEYFYTSVYNGSNITWMLLPDDNGVVVTAIMDGITPKQTVSSDKVSFQLWTRGSSSNPEIQKFDIQNSKNFSFTTLKDTKEMFILIHGFTDKVKKNYFFNSIVEALLKNGDYNVLGVNWSELGGIPWYGQSVNNTVFVGRLVAHALETLMMNNKNSKIHIVAYELGTLVAAVAADHLKTLKIDRITGLDPPYLLTKHLPKWRTLDKSDANLVEILHTSGDYMGINDPVGHRDFYANGGKWPQPGCTYDLADRCSPLRAIEYYSEAINKPNCFLGNKCPSFFHFAHGDCFSEPDLNLWNNVTKELQGKFYFLTRSKAPFCPNDE